MVYVFNPNTQKAEAEAYFLGFRTSFIYIVNFRAARRNKRKEEKRKKEKYGAGVYVAH